MSDYPEHEKVKALEESSAEVQGFLDWLDEQGYVIAVYKRVTDMGTVVESNSLHPAHQFKEGRFPFFETLMADYFGIDLKKFHDEKEQMYEQIKEMNRR